MISLPYFPHWTKEASSSGPPSERALLDLGQLDCFRGRVQVLFDVSLAIRAGEAVALIGRNGAGKTTLMRALAGLLPVRAKRFHFAGHALQGLAAYRIARLGIGSVPEERRVFATLTVAENLEVGRRSVAHGWTIERIVALFPALGELMGRRGDRLSGGEQQMLAIARTLMGNPRLLLLDEPAEGLAPLVVQQTVAAIQRIKREGVAILLAEQTPAFAEGIADRIYAIERGVVQSC